MKARAGTSTPHPRAPTLHALVAARHPPPSSSDFTICKTWARSHLHFVWEYIQGGELFSFLRSYGANVENNVAKFYAANLYTQIKANGYGRSVDWWAPGIEMIAGFPPFSDDDNIKLKLRFPKASKRRPKILQRFGNLQRGAGDVKAHAWFEAIDWERLLRLDIAAPCVPKVNEGDTSNNASTEFDWKQMHDYC
ncbi:hypothetical protein BC830DRAFT_1217978 [Chytriomyces sp. MP71]|nr:hypothetical protein BC830DRAFT_1217978 [Chytriomyces sp. MP71]